MQLFTLFERTKDAAFAVNEEDSICWRRYSNMNCEHWNGS